jgi:hypothetical protein
LKNSGQKLETRNWNRFRHWRNLGLERKSRALRIIAVGKGKLKSDSQRVQFQKNCGTLPQKPLSLNNVLLIFEANKMKRKDSLRSEPNNFAKKMTNLSGMKD